MDSKSIWLSKTFWINVFAIVAMVVQMVFTGFVVPAEWQVTFLGVVNIILRLVTKQPVVWS